MNYTALHSFAGLGLLALVAGCSASEPNETTTADDLTAGQLRFHSATLAAHHPRLTRSASGALFATYVDAGKLTVARSDDGGTHWTTLASLGGVKWDANLIVAPSNPDVLYLTRTGFYSWGMGAPPAGDDSYPTGLLLRSNDGGRTWASRTENLPEVHQGLGFDTIDVNPTNDQHLVAATCKGVQKSVDGGLTWRTLPSSGPSGDCNGAQLIRGIDDRKTIYVLYSVGEGGGSDIVRTYDDGVTWQHAKQEVDADYLVGVGNIVVHPDDAKHIYISDMRSFYSSADGGDHWFRHGRGLGESEEWVGPSDVAIDGRNDALYLTKGDSLFRWAPGAEPENGHWNNVAKIPGAELGRPVIEKGTVYVTTGTQLLIAPL